MYNKICELCGIEFESSSNRAKYCTNCRGKAQALRNAVYKTQKNAGHSKTIGSEQICPICKKTYVVKSGSQKLCKECQNKQRNLNKSVDPKYINNNYETIKLYVPKGQREQIKAYAKSVGQTVNKLFLIALDDYMKNNK